MTLEGMFKQANERLLPHLGHDIEIARYGTENIAVECVDCNEVLVDFTPDVSPYNAEGEWKEDENGN
jgi:hypothetical protein